MNSGTVSKQVSNHNRNLDITQRRRTRNIRLAGCGFDVLQHPLFAALCDQLPAQDTVFGEIHVGSEYVCVLAVKRLSLEVLAQRAMSCVVVLQSVVSVC
jgi:hypothetical protein